MRVFNEQQRFTQSWLVALIGVSILVPIGIIVKEFTNENSSMSTVEFVIIISVILFFSSIIFLFKLTTKIDENGIHYQFFPFHLSLKTIPWSEIKSIHVRKYNAISEYGGWGIKGWGKKHGTAINVSGSIGIQLELFTGKKLLIGTQREEDAKNSIANYQSKLRTNETQ